MQYLKVRVNTNKEMHITNHFLFMNDLKLLALNSNNHCYINNIVIKSSKTIRLEATRDMSATNSRTCKQTAILLKGSAGYKYFEIIENSKSMPTLESFKKIKAELFVRIKRLCNTKLDARNIVK